MSLIAYVDVLKQVTSSKQMLTSDVFKMKKPIILFVNFFLYILLWWGGGGG